LAIARYYAKLPNYYGRQHLVHVTLNYLFIFLPVQLAIQSSILEPYNAILGGNTRQRDCSH
jgi:hypothetical protein